jgi:hypothetical protein
MIAFGQYSPPLFNVSAISERRIRDMDFITYRAVFPAVPTGTDVVSQLFDIAVDGNDRPTQTLDKDASSCDFEVPQDASISTRLVYVDDAGNHSKPQLKNFTAIDDQPPAQPGEISIQTISERTVPDA